MTAIRLGGITRSLGGAPVLRGIDLSVAAGERVAVVGPSGAGKTTLVRILNLGLLPDSGTYELAGADTAPLRGAALRSARAKIATIHQQHDVVARLSVASNILAGRLGVWGWAKATRAFVSPSREDLEAASRVAARVGIAEKLFERADRLSGGQQQRVAIARALFQDARLVLADEPVASVDPSLAEEILSLLVRSAEEDGRTLVVNLHQPELVRRHFRRVVGIAHGRVEFDTAPENLGEAALAEFFTRRSESPEEPEDAGGRTPRPACRPMES